MLFAAGWNALALPYASVAVVALAVLIAAVIFWRCSLVYLVLPMVLPWLDLTPWTGRFYFDEFDVWVLVALGSALWNAKISQRSTLRRLDFRLLVALVVSFSVSTVVTFVNAHSTPAGFGNVYDNPLNALRTFKPVLYGIVFWALLARSEVSREKLVRLFTLGTALGLASTVMLVALERLRFCGLFNLTSDFRVTGPFADMHAGGAYLDVYLVAATPLLACLWRRASTWWERNLLILLLLGSLGAVCATLSRAPIIVLALQALLFTWWSIQFPKSKLGNRFPKLLVGASIVVVCVTAATMIPSIRVRFENTASAWETRVEHWRQSLDMLDDDWQTRLVGVGCGTYPKMFRRYANSETPGNYQFRTEGGRSYLRLTGGQTIYFGQYVAVKPDTMYTIVVKARRMSDTGALTVFLCEKNLLNSFRKSNVKRLFSTTPTGSWSTIEQPLDLGYVGGSVENAFSIPLRRPVMFNFLVTSRTVLDLDELQLLGSDGTNLLANGSFNAGHDRWWWTSDDHRSWHAFNLVVHLLIEQGWLGLLAFAAVSIRIIYLSVSCMKYSTDAISIACAIVGFLASGMTDSVIDSPRLLFLFVLLTGIVFCTAWPKNNIDGCAD